MSPTERQRSTRDRPAKAPLSEEAVVDAALEILAAEGLAAVTMRRVATALDTGPASLYVYVSGRDGLLRAISDRIIAGIDLETPDPDRWRAQLHALLIRTRDVLVAHPGLAITMISDPPTSEPTLMIMENMLGLMLAGGFGAQSAAWGSDICWLLVTYAAIEDEARHRDVTELAGQMRDVFASLPPDRFPLISAHADELVAGSGDQRFHFAIDAVLDGMRSPRRPR